MLGASDTAATILGVDVVTRTAFVEGISRDCNARDLLVVDGFLDKNPHGNGVLVDAADCRSS